MSSTVHKTLPYGWQVLRSKSTGTVYYYNRYTKKAQWDKPEGPAIRSPGNWRKRKYRWDRLEQSRSRSRSPSSTGSRSPSPTHVQEQERARERARERRRPRSPSRSRSRSSSVSYPRYYDLPTYHRYQSRSSSSSTDFSSRTDPHDEVRCSHILIKHRQSRRPFNYHDEHVNRSRNEARKFAQELRELLHKKESTFEELAKIFSECSSARRLGDLGRFRKGQMHKTFERAAFTLRVGQLSRVVESVSGYHIILRTG